MRISCVAKWALVAALLIGGCSKLTYDNWRAIDIGADSPDTVRAMLGDPWMRVDQTWIYNDRDRDVTAMIKFEDNRVVGKEWADAKRGMETVGEQPDEPGESETLRIRQVK